MLPAAKLNKIFESPKEKGKFLLEGPIFQRRGLLPNNLPLSKNNPPLIFNNLPLSFNTRALLSDKRNLSGKMFVGCRSRLYI